jgi:hypothetical protein
MEDIDINKLIPVNMSEDRNIYQIYHGNLPGIHFTPRYVHPVRTDLMINYIFSTLEFDISFIEIFVSKRN